MKIGFISDTHLRHLNYPIDIPKCDLLIHSGDACINGDYAEVLTFFEWFDGLPADRKVFIAGNHDWLFEKDPKTARKLVPSSVDYLQDELIEINGLKIYGSPWQPEFCDWAFNLKRGWPLRKKWEAVPAGVDILITHGPPMGILDWSNFGGEHAGCEGLRQELGRIKPKIHAFGHIHGSYGIATLAHTLFVNAATCDEGYVANHPPIIVELAPGKDPVVLPGPGLPPPERKPVSVMDVMPPLW